MDAEGKPPVMKFDLIEGNTPLFVGLDILQYARIDNFANKLSLFQAP